MHIRLWSIIILHMLVYVFCKIWNYLPEWRLWNWNLFNFYNFWITKLMHLGSMHYSDWSKQELLFFILMDMNRNYLPNKFKLCTPTYYNIFEIYFWNLQKPAKNIVINLPARSKFQDYSYVEFDDIFVLAFNVSFNSFFNSA